MVVLAGLHSTVPQTIQTIQVSEREREGIEYCIVISFEQLIIDPLVKEKKTEIGIYQEFSRVISEPYTKNRGNDECELI